MATLADKVLIAVDGSQYSSDAFDWYFSHMHKAQNEVLLVHCMELPLMPSRDTWEEQSKEGKKKGMAVCERYIQKLNDMNITPNIMMDFEKPGEMIVCVAEKEKATVIVMGTRGMGKLARTFLGSVSNYVLNHASCPVLVCKSQK